MKNRTANTGAPGKRARPAGYAMNARPGPEDNRIVSTQIKYFVTSLVTALHQSNNQLQMLSKKHYKG